MKITISARERARLAAPREMFAVVADDGLENDIDAQQVELFGEVERVGVLAERSQQLRADGDDLGVHGLRV